MRPQDPNFPPEIPPVPPARNGGEALPREDERLTPPLPEQRAEARQDDAIPVDVIPADGDDIDHSSSLMEPSYDPRPPSPLAAGPANPTLGRDRPYTPDPAPWTDSDLADIEDPLPVTPPKPQPTYIDRRQRPAAGPYKSARPAAPAEDVWADTEIPYQPKELGVVDQLLLLLAEGVTQWKKVLRWVRSQLPTDLQRQLSDAVLTAIALGLLMLMLALWNPLGTGQGEQVAAEPQPGTAVEEPALPAEPNSPGEPGVDSALNPAPDPTPVLEPTPEQNLIADIQSRVSRISRSYGAGLIQSVEVNLPENTLGVNVAETWYGLLATQQDEVAQDIYSQAQGLKFGTLQLRDPEGVVVARNPVVGPNMVVLHRLR